MRACGAAGTERVSLQGARAGTHCLWFFETESPCEGCSSFGNDRQATDIAQAQFGGFLQMPIEIVE